jgi:hypothetical protein
VEEVAVDDHVLDRAGAVVAGQAIELVAAGVAAVADLDADRGGVGLLGVPGAL